MLPFIWLVILLRVGLINIASAQSGTARCVPIGLCFAQPFDVNPRIITPGGGGQPTGNTTQGCTAGFELCYPNQGTTACGIRYTNGTSGITFDGPTTQGTHPWQVYMMNQTMYIGSGVLLAPNIVLTAAHKVFNNVNTPENIRIYTGVNNPTGIAIPPASFSRASRIRVHNNFKVSGSQPVDFKDDLALILLDTPQQIGYRTDLALGCLPTSTNSFVDNSNCIVGGWGETAFRSGGAGEIHKQVQVPIVSMATCKQSMLRSRLGVEGTAKYLDEENELCAGGQAQKDACTQDGGAPLMCLDANTNRFVIAGLVIWGIGCGQQGVYGVYVNVAKYTGWITDNMNALLAKK